MFRLLFLVFCCSTFIVSTKCSQPDIFEVISKFREQKGIDPESDNLKRYSSTHDNEASAQLQNHNFDENTNSSSLSFLPNDYAAIFGLVNAPGALCYDIKILNAIVGKIASERNSHFLLDMAYNQVTIVMGAKKENGDRPYCLLFSIPRDSVRTLMAKRICNVAPVQNACFGAFDRLTYYFFISLDLKAEYLINGLKEDKIDPEINTVIDVSIPYKDVNSWDNVVRYLASGKNPAATKAILDPYNFTVGMDYKWLPDENNPVSLGCLRVVMVFEKMRTTGESSVFGRVLKLIKNARSNKKIENDLLGNVYPTAEANKIAEDIVEGNKSETTALYEWTIYNDSDREENPYCLIEQFENKAIDWITAAENPKTKVDKKISETIFYGPYTGIGFAAKVIMHKVYNQPYLRFCIFFSGKSDA